jgi:hypothetical protein
LVAVSTTTRTSHWVKDSIQLRDSIRTLSLWIRSSLYRRISEFSIVSRQVFFSPLLAWEKIKYCQAKHSFYLQEHKYVESLRLNFVGLNILALFFWFFPSPPLPAIIAGFMMSWCLWCTWMHSSLVSMMLLKCKFLAFQCRYIALFSFLSNVYESISTRMTLVTEMAPLGDISHWHVHHSNWQILLKEITRVCAVSCPLRTSFH